MLGDVLAGRHLTGLDPEPGQLRAERVLTVSAAHGVRPRITGDRAGQRRLAVILGQGQEAVPGVVERQRELYPSADAIERHTMRGEQQFRLVGNLAEPGRFVMDEALTPESAVEAGRTRLAALPVGCLGRVPFLAPGCELLFGDAHHRLIRSRIADHRA